MRMIERIALRDEDKVMPDKKPTTIQDKPDVSQDRRKFVRNVLVSGGLIAGAGTVGSGLVSSAFAGEPTTTPLPPTTEFPGTSTTTSTTTPVPPTTTVAPPTTTLAPPTTTLAPPTTTVTTPPPTTTVTTPPPTTTRQPAPQSVPALSITGLAALASAIGGTAAYAEMKRRDQETIESPVESGDDE